jgi:hypothetical protein
MEQKIKLNTAAINYFFLSNLETYKNAYNNMTIQQ